MSETLQPLRLRHIRLEAEHIASYEFVAADGGALPAFTAGAHIDLHLPGALVRSYSLVNDPAERDRYLVAVQRETDGKGGSAWMHSVPRVGDVLRASAPVNDFPLAEGAVETIFIAGGIGITPIIAMIHRLNALGRPWRLHYAARSAQTAAFIPELQALAASPDRVALCLRSARAQRLDLKAIAQFAPAGAHLYCCGPGAMIDDFLSACASLPAANVHVERFSASSEAATEGGFQLKLARDGRVFEVVSGKSILDTLLDQGVDVQYACSAGVCGTCRTVLLDGEADHRDDYLTDEEKRENKSIMICCSGARSKTLVLDL